MNLQELAEKENHLYNIVISLQGTEEERIQQLQEKGVFEQYKLIHQAYAEGHKQDLEALKRGLFLTWYATVERPYVTGIRELNPEAEHKVISTLDNRLKRNKIDYELEWMLHHYTQWEGIFERFDQFKELQNKLKRVTMQLPTSIDNQYMSTRGQMGIYWNFLITFQ